jgi:hypothetical protein
MHVAAHRYVRRAILTYGPWATVVEIGSLNINGSIRRLFGDCRYTGLDLVPGPGVDVVTEATTWTPIQPVGCVVCCEVLEHAPNAPGLVAAASKWLHPGGHLIVTCAGPGREPHSAIDGGPLRDGEHYQNLGADRLACMAVDAGLTVLDVELVHGDTRMVAHAATG